MLRCAILTTLIHLVQVRCQKLTKVANVSFSVPAEGLPMVCVYHVFLHLYLYREICNV